MGKHSLPANITQPPNPEPGLKLVRFWENGFGRCVSNTLVINWYRDVDFDDWRASFDLWPEHPLAEVEPRELLSLMVTTNEDVPVVWSIDRIGRKESGVLRVFVISWQQQMERFLIPDWLLLDPDHPVDPPITRYGGDE